MTRGWTHGILRATRALSPLEIVKVGGSLLTLPDWPELLRELVRRRSESRPVLVVVGGGAIVDGLRSIDAVARRPEAISHSLAIGLLGTTARLVADALSLPIVVTHGADPAAVLDTPAWLVVADRLARLPVGWHVTSDSIAAEVAGVTGGDLLLAKSVAPPTWVGDGRLEPLARSGWVDAHFPTAAAAVGRIVWTTPAAAPGPMPGVVR